MLATAHLMTTNVSRPFPNPISLTQAHCKFTHNCFPLFLSLNDTGYFASPKT